MGLFKKKAKTFTLICPECSNPVQKYVEWLETDEPFTCPDCGKTADIDKGECNKKSGDDTDILDSIAELGL